MCSLANGVSIPKPSFSGSGSILFAFPRTVSSATLVRDTLTVTITNGFNFDPLRPSATARGYMTLFVQNAGTAVGRLDRRGGYPLPASGSLVCKIPRRRLPAVSSSAEFRGSRCAVARPMSRTDGVRPVARAFVRLTRAWRWSDAASGERRSPAGFYGERALFSVRISRQGRDKSFLSRTDTDTYGRARSDEKTSTRHPRCARNGVSSSLPCCFGRRQGAGG